MIWWAAESALESEVVEVLELGTLFQEVLVAKLETVETAFEVPESEVLELFEVLELGTLFQAAPEAELEDVVELETGEVESVGTARREVLELGTLFQEVLEAELLLSRY